jgi:hypothetical protein
MTSEKELCKWCGKEIEGKGWKDGPNIYCNFQCFSANSCWHMLGIALFMTPIVVAITTPWMQGVLLEKWQMLGPFWSLVCNYVFISIALLTLLFLYYTAFLGWRVRSNETDPIDSTYPSEEYRTYDSE